MVYCVVRTEHPCPQLDDVHGLLRSYQKNKRLKFEQTVRRCHSSNAGHVFFTFFCFLYKKNKKKLEVPKNCVEEVSREMGVFDAGRGGGARS